jgi:hypothetical protein
MWLDDGIRHLGLPSITAVFDAAVLNRRVKVWLVASLRAYHHVPSCIRSTAGLAGFLILIHALHRPER